MRRERGHRRLELACFAALAGFAALEWASLVADPPIVRAALAAAIATGAGVGLIALGRAKIGRGARAALGAAAALASIALGMVAIGLPAEFLLPWRWDELVTTLGQSLNGISDISVPYDGADPWTRLTILLAVPLGVGLAAVAAFSPGRRRAAGRLAALALLLGLYLSANAWSRPGGDLGRGLLLCLLVCAWLWLPMLAPDRRGTGLLAVGAAAAVALPLAAALAPENALFDYRSWRLLSQDGINFGWAHSYGPLDWPQKGTRVLTVASEEPHYWKATTLDEFDGFGWRRSDEVQPEPLLGTPVALQDFAPPGNQVAHPEWIDRLNFDVRGLSSDVVVGAGTVLSVRSVDASPSPDATWATEETLESGDEYTVLAYMPEPSETQMRVAPLDYPASAGRYTALTIPAPDGIARDVQVPFWRGPAPDEDTASAFRDTAYERTYDLARQVTAGAATPYDAVTRLEAHLRGSYAYDQNTPERAYPLPAFLFDDRRGYCQQFSGAMALMLRMIGIPARVASGFAPGGRDPDKGTFLVEDVDAHSWVEVYFAGIGWVPFEPTPAAAPAESQLNDNADGGAAEDSETTTIDAQPSPSSDSSGDGESNDSRSQPLASSTAGTGGDGPSPAEVGGGIGLVALLGLYAAYALRALRRRRLQPDSLAAAEIGELERTLERLDRRLPAGATLRDAGRRLERLAGPAGSRYAASLRERRYRRPSSPPPGVRERRALRRALLAARGWRAVAAVLAAIPPGGPRRSRH